MELVESKLDYFIIGRTGEFELLLLHPTYFPLDLICDWEMENREGVHQFWSYSIILFLKRTSLVIHLPFWTLVFLYCWWDDQLNVSFLLWFRHSQPTCSEKYFEEESILISKAFIVQNFTEFELNVLKFVDFITELTFLNLLYLLTFS